MSDHDDEDFTENGKRTMAEMAAEDEDGQMEAFPLGAVDGDGVALKSLIKAGHSVSTTVSLMTAEVPAPKGSLLNPDKEGMLLVTYEVAGYEPVPQREGDRHSGKNIRGWKIRQKLRPIYVERVEGNGAEIQANFALLQDADETAAGALLDTLKEMYAAKLAGGKHPSRVPA